MVTRWYKWENKSEIWRESIRLEAKKIMNNKTSHEQEVFLFNVLKNADILEPEEGEQWSTNCEPFYKFLRAII